MWQSILSLDSLGLGFQLLLIQNPMTTRSDADYRQSNLNNNDWIPITAQFWLTYVFDLVLIKIKIHPFLSTMGLFLIVNWLKWLINVNIFGLIHLIFSKIDWFIWFLIKSTHFNPFFSIINKNNVNQTFPICK